MKLLRRQITTLLSVLKKRDRLGADSVQTSNGTSVLMEINLERGLKWSMEFPRGYLKFIKMENVYLLNHTNQCTKGIKRNCKILKHVRNDEQGSSDIWFSTYIESEDYTNAAYWSKWWDNIISAIYNQKLVEAWL